MKVFILAGGLGTRIRALFPDRPKCLIPVCGRPFLEWQIEQLAAQGFREFVLCLSHLSEQVVNHFQNGAAWGVRIEYSVEAEPRGTAGALRAAGSFFHDTALVLNGDTYLATGYRALVEAHRLHVQRSDAIGSLGLVKAPDMQRYGQVVLDDDRRITAFREKQPAPSGAGLISAGAYVLEPTVLNHIPAGRPVSIEQETFPELAERRVLRGIPIEGDFVDMGTPGGHAALEALLR